MKPLYLIVGPSGSGKSTIERELCELLGLSAIKSYTDRPQRFPDEDGHIFVTTEAFNSLNDVVTHTVFAGYQYGTTKACLDNADVFVVDPNGVKEVAELYEKEQRDIIVIGITAPYNMRKRRMENRGDSYDQIMKRLLHDHTVYDDMDMYCDLIVPNIDLKKTVMVIERYIGYVDATITKE